MIPILCNKAEICSSRAKDEDLVILRFFYEEPKMTDTINPLKRPYPMLYPGPAVVMPRKRMKEVLKKFLTWMAAADEGRKE